MMRRVSSGVSNSMVVQKKKIKKKIRNWHKSVVLFLLLIIYLVMGALIFCAIEGDNQVAAQQSLNEYSMQFLERHDACLNITDLREYVDLLLAAIDSGAVLNKEFDAPANEDGTLRELWNLPNAFFFSSTVVTTIGYGNLAPRTPLGRILCICYALIGIPMTGWMLSSIGQTFQEKWRFFGRLIRKITRQTKSRSVNNFVHVLFVFFLAYSTIIIVPALIISYAEGWLYIDAHYFCFISLTTIGFGDLAPVSWTEANNRIGQWVYTVLYVTYLLLGLSILSVALTSFLAKHRKQISSAKKKFQTIAKSATVKVIEAAERNTPGGTPENSIKKKGEGADLPDEFRECDSPTLLRVTPRSTSIADSQLPQWVGSETEEMEPDSPPITVLPPWLMFAQINDNKNNSEDTADYPRDVDDDSYEMSNYHGNHDKTDGGPHHPPLLSDSMQNGEYSDRPNESDNLHEYDIINSSDL